MVSLYERICDYANLESAYKKARKGKTKRPYVLEFELKLEENLLALQDELVNHTYTPRQLESFILRDPKTRRISRSDFRDRVVHHALCNVIEPLFDKNFIFDSFANRKGKGVLKALARFDAIKRKISRNHTKTCFVLKADIRKYFDTVDHEVLLKMIAGRVRDERVLWLIRQILGNFRTEEGKGMPLGNLTSQFFANVYLNELDQFVKHELKAPYYIRYVDDFVIFSHTKTLLELQKAQIDGFLKRRLLLRLHPEKSKIIELLRGVPFLGMRVFPFHRLLLRKNLRGFQKKWEKKVHSVQNGASPYDELYDFVEGWDAYSKSAQTYKLRRDMKSGLARVFPGKTSSKECARYMRSHVESDLSTR